MTEQTPDTVPPKSLPEDLGPVGAPPNDLRPPDWKRTAMVVWILVGVLFFVGVVSIVVGARDLRLPSAPDFSFDLPELSLPEMDVPLNAPPTPQERPPDDMQVSSGGDAQPVGQIDKPGGTDAPGSPN